MCNTLNFCFRHCFFYSAILAPICWLWTQLRATGRLFNHIVTYVARRRSWSLLQEIALGLESYSFELPQAEREPTFACKTIYEYEDLPKNVEAARSSEEGGVDSAQFW